jgi:hypothetical protein
VYFDINPHDGLLETHVVDESLKEKLKCLVFIEVISRAYCDLKSFTWEHEFKAFIEQTLNDQFGLRVKFTRGNIAGRILIIVILGVLMFLVNRHYRIKWLVLIYAELYYYCGKGDLLYFKTRRNDLYT